MVWMTVSETQWHEKKIRGEAIPEVDRERAAQAEERAPPKLRNSRIGTTPEEHIAEHRSRIELGVMLAEVAQTRMRRERSLRKACRWSESTAGYLWSRSAEIAGDFVEAEDDDGGPLDGVKTSSPRLTALGGARQPSVDEAHVMGGLSHTCLKAMATAKETSQSSAKS